MSLTFADDLRLHGPDSTQSVTREQARDYCARLTASHYENFSVVTWLTPKPLRPHFQSIYAFCRWSDDLGDEIGDRQRSRELLAWWRGELQALYQDREPPRHPVMLALQETVREFAIPIEPFLALISAFEQDQDVLEYRDDAQLLDYCKRSADPVGELVLYLARAHNPAHVSWSNAICTGLQLANFWQDVDRDLTIGRVYLPKADRDRFGYSDDDLHARRFTPQFAALLRHKVEQARDLLNQGEPLAARMPPPLDVDVALFRKGGLAILKRIEAQGFDVWKRRPEVTKLAKVGLLLQAVAGSSLSRWRRPSVSPAAGISKAPPS